MKTSEKVLQLLLKKQAFLSGQELADELNVSSRESGIVILKA